MNVFVFLVESKNNDDGSIGRPSATTDDSEWLRTLGVMPWMNNNR